MTFISYAQNYEDVLLNRVFKDKTQGFYIDIGALHPTFDSVTKAFYDRGWTGINIEPIKEFYSIFIKDRPRDINLNIAISNTESNLDFFEVLGQPGNSTLNKDIAYKIAQEKGLDVVQYAIPVKTLASICQEYVNQKIDFLKIDVEGLEEEVILGGVWELFRPTILLIETTLPNTNIRCENNIPEILKQKGYQHVFFDGINDYYIAEESKDLVRHFSYPVNVLDFYVNYIFIEQQRQINELSTMINLNNNALQIVQQNNCLSENIILYNPIILIDCVFFQFYQTGIARVWKSLFQEWANNGFAKHIIIVDRAGTAPKIPGIRYRTIPECDYNNTEADKQMLQQICNEEKADLFISSYYTTPITTPSVFMAYDMIPEVMGYNLNPIWREKHQSIKHASAYIAISQNTARDLCKYFPNIAVQSITVAHCGVSNTFSPAEPLQINTFKHRYGINKPYFLLGGNLVDDYKNNILFLKAFSKLANRYEFDIIFTGLGGAFAPELRDYTSGSAVHLLQLSDEELAIAYSGAVALVYPSKYEGFGMPIVEAMACGCPVITCPNSSILEVAGEAAIYVNDDDVEAMANALISVQNHNLRTSLITAGLAQAQKFSWTKMAEKVSSALIDATSLSLKLREINLIIFPDSSQPEQSIYQDLVNVITALENHPDSEKITLLINASNFPSQFTQIFMDNLCKQDEEEINEGLEISLVGKLSPMQWESLLPQLTARIILSNEDQQVIEQLQLEKLPSYQIDNLENQLFTLLKVIRQNKYQVYKNCVTYNIKEIPLSLPPDHALPQYQNMFRLYDKFIGVLAKHLPNNEDLIVDIGANVGDTTALLLQYCENPILCIEADTDFFSIMEYNLSDYRERITFVNSFVSAKDLKNVELVKNRGTARAVESKDKLVKSDSLVSIIKNSELGKCILLKTDTDGFDLEILLSSLSRIEEDSPILYWENEISSLKDIEDVKKLLEELGKINYTKYIVLDNFGNPLIYEGTSEFVKQINEYLLNNKYNKNQTFYYTDIAAFPDKYSYLVATIASDYNNFIRSSNVYP
jgi:FkbM family methyltransferase